MEFVTLNNGTEEPKPTVLALMVALESLIKQKVLVFYDLVMACRDEKYTLSEDCIQHLSKRGLFPIHDSVRNVVLCAVTGDGLGMRLGSPYEAGAE